MMKSKLLLLLVLAAVALIIYLLPTPQGLSQTAHAVLAVTLFTAGLWLFQVMNNGVASVLMMGLLVAAQFPERPLCGN